MFRRPVSYLNVGLLAKKPFSQDTRRLNARSWAFERPAAATNNNFSPNLIGFPIRFYSKLNQIKSNLTKTYEHDQIHQNPLEFIINFPLLSYIHMTLSFQKNSSFYHPKSLIIMKSTRNHTTIMINE